MFTISEKIKEQKSFSKAVHNIQDCKLKAIMNIIITAIFVIFILFSTASKYACDNVYLTLNGVDIITAVLYGNQIMLNQFGTNLIITIPFIFNIVFYIQISLCLFSCVYTSVLAFKKNQDSKLGGYLQLVSVGISLILYILMFATDIFQVLNHNGEKVLLQSCFSFEMPLMAIMLFQLFIAVIQIGVQLNVVSKVKKSIVKYILLVIPTIYIFVFCLYPIFLQVVLSFKTYVISDGIWGSEWVLFDNFIKIFTDSTMQKIMINTIYISGIRLVVGIVFPLAFSLVLYEMTAKKYRKFVQTIVYIPHFFSWVIIYAIVFAFLSPDGVVSNLSSLSGKKTDFLTDPNLFIPILIISSTWKELGWGTIMYLAALSNVDISLYEAAEVDGAGVFRKLFNITLPSILPIIAFMTIMAVGNLLKGAGGEQILIFANSAVKEKGNVIDTWVYWQGLNKLEYGLGAAVSFVQSIIGIVLVLGCNKLSTKLTGIGAW